MKLVDDTQLDADLTSVANAIRTKGGTSASLSFPDDFVEAIGDIPTGGTLQTKSKSYTPTESAQSETVTADAGYDGLQQVSVSVGAISSTYVGSGITQRSSSDLTASTDTVTVPAGYYASSASKAVASGSATTPATTITATPTISIGSDAKITASVSTTQSVTPTVSAGYVSSGTAGTITVSGSATSQMTKRTSSDLSASGATVTAPAGYYPSAATKSVSSGTEGTPTATKGTVSSNTMLITPSVINSAGYISGGTHTGTAVSVTAAELVSGSETKTANGTYDVTNLAQLIVNVSGGGSGLVYETGTYTPTADTTRPTISFANSHTEAPILIALSDASEASSLPSNSIVTFNYYDPYKLFNTGFPMSTSSLYYALIEFTYRSSNSFTGSRVGCSYNSSNSGSSNTSYPRYWVTESQFRPYGNSTSRYFRSGRNYKWIAVWKPTS